MSFKDRLCAFGWTKTPCAKSSGRVFLFRCGVRSVDGGTDLKLAPAGVGFWEVAAEHLMRTDQHQVPNCPSLRPRQFGTGFWSVRIRSPASAGPKPDPEARHY
jgi:hypothetical protein